MESLESQITSMDRRLNLALVEKLNRAIVKIESRISYLTDKLNAIEKILKSNFDKVSKEIWIEEFDNLSKSEKEWLDGRSKVLNDKKLPKIEKIALLNDELRKKLITGELFKADSKDKAFITRGASIFVNGMNRMQLLNNVALYRNFTEDNNPYGERDLETLCIRKRKDFLEDRL